MTRNPMTIYLSGPMTGIPKHNYPAFEEAYVRLTSEGHTVISPHKLDYDDGLEHGKSEDGFTVSDEEYVELLDRDFARIEECDAICFLPGWERSGGAGREGEKALKLGLKLFVYWPEGRRQWGTSLLGLNEKRFQTLHTKQRVTRAAA